MPSPDLQQAQRRIDEIQSLYRQWLRLLPALQAAQPDTPLFIYDPADTRVPPRLFHYERADAEHYYLRSVGADNVPFTADDILPPADTAGGKIGLLKEKARP